METVDMYTRCLDVSCGHPEDCACVTQFQCLGCLSPGGGGPLTSGIGSGGCCHPGDCGYVTSGTGSE